MQITHKYIALALLQQPHLLSEMSQLNVKKIIKHVHTVCNNYKQANTSYQKTLLINWSDSSNLKNSTFLPNISPPPAIWRLHV